MSSNRLTRVNELLKREIASCLIRMMSDDGFDISALTVTNVSISPDLRHARVGVSILGHEQDRQEMLNELKQRRKDIQHEVTRFVTLKYTPRLSFYLDETIEAGDRVLNLIHQLELEEQHHDEDTHEPGKEV